MLKPFAPILKVFSGLCVAVLTGCASLPMVDVSSANQNSRVQFLVLHFTSATFEESMRLLTQRTERPVSVHYLVPEPGDSTYPHRDLRIFRLVPEHRRAWHAGKSFWRGKQGLNDSSIGIEIVNRSFCQSSDPEAEPQTPEMQSCTFLEYPEEQIDLVVRLAKDILDRHPEIDAFDVVAHSDIAPTRRLDPGPQFPWRRLHEEGIGAWYDEQTFRRHLAIFQASPPAQELVRRALRAYGYGIDDGRGDDLQERYVVRAFQLHFRPSRTDGVVDAETAAILFALLEKYRPGALRRVLESA